jgi:hypothetical protein
VLLCRWDLDKTYLRTEFETVRQLLRTAFERAEDKVEVPGVAEVIKGIGETAARQGRRALVYFLSASPPQIGRAIRDKLALDGVPYDGIVFKDQLGYLRRGKLRVLREHVGFKLVHLLRGRLEAPLEARELLFGDDWESDSLIYALYADILGSSSTSGRSRRARRARTPSTASSSTSNGGRLPPCSTCSGRESSRRSTTSRLQPCWRRTGSSTRSRSPASPRISSSVQATHRGGSRTRSTTSFGAAT